IDSRNLAVAVGAIEKRTGKKPAADSDFRRIIDDPSIDAVAIGTPDHWHAIPTIMACLAGKDVYVEKPDSHNIVEGQRMVAAMRRTISTAGGKWYFDDMQEWQDTLQVNFEYEIPNQSGRILTYEMRIWAPYPYHGVGDGAAVFGDEAYIVIGNQGWKAFGNNGALIAEDTGRIEDALHFQNFVDCVKSRKKPNADLEM